MALELTFRIKRVMHFLSFFDTPKHVIQFDRMIECLSPNCIRAIRTCYVCKGQWALMEFDSKKSYLYWLRRAEIALIN